MAAASRRSLGIHGEVIAFTCDAWVECKQPFITTIMGYKVAFAFIHSEAAYLWDNAFLLQGQMYEIADPGNSLCAVTPQHENASIVNSIPECDVLLAIRFDGEGTYVGQAVSIPGHIFETIQEIIEARMQAGEANHDEWTD